MQHEISEHAIFVGGELHRLAVDRDARGLGVDAERSAFHLVAGVPRRAPKQRADARQHFLHVEGLGDIIVGAGIHAGDLVAPPLARGEDQHRHLALVAPPLLEHAQAVLLGKTEIEHHGVVRLGIAEKMPLLAVERGIDGVARIAQSGDELTVEVWIVLDDEKPQSRYPSLSCMEPRSPKTARSERQR